MANATGQLNKTAHPFTREAFEDVMRQRFFYTPAFEIYGGPLHISPNFFSTILFLSPRCEGSAIYWVERVMIASTVKRKVLTPNQLPSYLQCRRRWLLRLRSTG